MGDRDLRADIQRESNGQFRLRVWLFAATTGLPTRVLHAEHSFFSADEAKDYGLVDQVISKRA